MNTDKEELKGCLLELLDTYGGKRDRKAGRDMYTCPMCGSGTRGGHNSDGALHVSMGNGGVMLFKCFNCGVGGDIFSLYRAYHGLPKDGKRFRKDMDSIKEELVIATDNYDSFKTSYKFKGGITALDLTPQTESEYKKDRTNFFGMAIQKQYKAVEYLTSRGIQHATKIAEAFQLGYTGSYAYEWEDNKPSKTTPAVIIPMSKYSYAWRSTTDSNKKKSGVIVPLNLATLRRTFTKYVFLVEGEFDLFSILDVADDITDCEFSAISLSSAGNLERFIRDYIHPNIKADTVLIIALDNDPIPNEQVEKYKANGLETAKRYGIPCVVADVKSLYLDTKDANTGLQKDRQAFTDALLSEVEKAKTMDMEAYRKECERLKEEQQRKLTVDEYFGKSYAYNDIGRVERLKTVANNRYRYCNQLNSWYIYNQELGVLELNQDNTFKGVLHRGLDANFSSELEELQQMGGSDDKIKRSLVHELEKEHKSAISMRNFNATLDRLTWEKEIAIRFENIDRPELLNLKDVTINLNTLEVIPHSIENTCTKYVDAEFNAPLEPWAVKLWGDFINSIMVKINENGEIEIDPELVEFLQRSSGYSFAPINKEECFFILYGATTRNGKSTFISALQGVMGGYSTAVSSTTLAETKPSDGAKPEILALKGSKLITCGELHSETTLNDTLLKSGLGRDTICVRALYSNTMVPFTIDGKIFANCNELPPMRNDDLLTSKRIIPIPFYHHFEEQEQNKELKGQLLHPDVKNVIFHWLWDGYLAYIEKGIKADMPQAVLKELEHYESIATSVNMFLNSEDNFETLDENNIEKSTPINATTIKQMYNRYKDFCFDNGMRAVSLKNFKSAIERNRHYKAKKQKDGKAYYRILWGLKLRTSTNSIDDAPKRTPDQGERMAEKYQKVRYKDYNSQ